jgi:cysteine-rich repeat protein
VIDADDNRRRDVATDVVYIARRLLGFLEPVPPSFRVLDPTIPPDAEIAARIDAMGNALDVDGNGAVDVATDLVYIARRLLGLPPVPPSFRALKPDIPLDSVIGANVDALCLAYCGDGVVEPESESCDDGNNIDGDGCSANCLLEPGSSIHSATGPSFSVLNRVVPDPAPQVHTAVGPSFSVLNRAVPEPLLRTALGPSFSVLNGVVPDPAPQMHTAIGPSFSALNTAVADPAPQLTSTVGPTFSVLNTVE